MERILSRAAYFNLGVGTTLGIFFLFEPHLTSAVSAAICVTGGACLSLFFHYCAHTLREQGKNNKRLYKMLRTIEKMDEDREGDR